MQKFSNYIKTNITFRKQKYSKIERFGSYKIEKKGTKACEQAI